MKLMDSPMLMSKSKHLVDSAIALSWNHWKFNVRGNTDLRLVLDNNWSLWELVPLPHFRNPSVPSNLSSEKECDSGLQLKGCHQQTMKAGCGRGFITAHQLPPVSCLLPSESANLLRGEKQARKWTNHNVRLQRRAGKTAAQEREIKPGGVTWPMTGRT